jgi:hypothetical protein
MNLRGCDGTEVIRDALSETNFAKVLFEWALTVHMF